ncbi:TetR/AcrR family transcriptional regulator [Nocardioides baekrokdamisoli]|nr:TetR/AcrR family transcriptional regulator [Nocardioides baekrokdamisoli]
MTDRPPITPWKSIPGNAVPWKSGGPSGPGRTKLSVDVIVDVAMRQLRARGYDAVTMRSIATELGTGPASLYAHVANRNELDSLVNARISSMAYVPDPDPDPGRWDEQIAEVARELLRLYREHPGTARCTMGNMPASIEALDPVEKIFAILRAGGVPDQDAAWFGDQFSLYVASFAMEEDIWKSRARADNLSEAEAWDHIPPVFANLSATRFPVLTSLAGALTNGDADERFNFGVDLMIQGLKARKG